MMIPGAMENGPGRNGYAGYFFGYLSRGICISEARNGTREKQFPEVINRDENGIASGAQRLAITRQLTTNFCIYPT